MVLGIQIVGSLFGLFMLYMTYIRRKREEFTVKEYGAWALFWIFFVLMALFPNWLDPFVKSLKLYRTMDLFVIIGFMFLTGAVFYTYSIVRRVQSKIEEVVRNTAFLKRKK